MLNLTLKNRPVTSASCIIPTILKAVNLEEVNNSLLHDVMEAVVKTNSEVTKHSDTLFTSYQLFQDTPGYRETTWRILTNPDNTGIVKGHMYELETALLLMRLGKQVRAFNQIITCEPYKCEFDLITDDELIECKSIYWPSYTKNRLGNQFIQQAALADLRKETNEMPHNYLVASRQTITPSWKNWFNNQKIQFQE